MSGYTTNGWDRSSGMAGFAGNDFSSLGDWSLPQTQAAIPNLPDLASGSVAGAAGAGNPSLFSSLSGWLDNSGVLGKTLGDGTKVQGWGGLGLGAASGIMNSWLGLQQLGLAKDAAVQNKKQFDLNYAAQAKTTNARLEDQQRARVASNPTAYASIGDYMKKYGIGG